MNTRIRCGWRGVLTLVALTTVGFDKPQSVVLLVQRTWAQPQRTWVSSTAPMPFGDAQPALFWVHPVVGTVALIVREFAASSSRGDAVMRELYVSNNSKQATKVVSWDDADTGPLTAMLTSQGSVIFETKATRIELAWVDAARRFQVLSRVTHALSLPPPPSPAVSESGGCKIVEVARSLEGEDGPMFMDCAGKLRVSAERGGSGHVDLCLFGDVGCDGVSGTVNRVEVSEVTGDDLHDYIFRGSYAAGMCEVEYLAIVVRTNDSWQLAFRGDTKQVCDEDDEPPREYPVEVLGGRNGGPTLLKHAQQSYRWNGDLAVFMESSADLQKHAVLKLRSGDYDAARELVAQGEHGYPRDAVKFSAIAGKIRQAEVAAQKQREISERKRQAAVEREQRQLAQEREAARAKVLQNLGGFVAAAGSHMNRALSLCMTQVQCAYAPLAAFGFGCPGCRGAYEDALRRVDQGATLQNVIDIVRALPPLAVRRILGIALGDAEALRELVDKL